MNKKYKIKNIFFVGWVKPYNLVRFVSFTMTNEYKFNGLYFADLQLATLRNKIILRLANSVTILCYTAILYFSNNNFLL